MTEPSVHSSGSGDRTSLTLLQKARANDRGAWERIDSLYAPLIVHWCRVGGLQDADAADIRQEVFLAVSHALCDFRHDSTPGKFRAWLKTITLNKIRDRRQRTPPGQTGVGGSDAYELLAQVPSPLTDDSSDPTAEGEKGILYRRAVELIATDFSEQTCKAFERTVLDGQKIKDVAAELGMTQNAVSLAKARVLARLHAEFVGLIDK